MAEHLQGLLNKIQEEGLKKAEVEKQSILDNARTEAAQIVAQARDEADQLRTRAEADAAALQSRAESAVKQAARDVILALENELKQRLNTVFAHSAAQAMTPEFMTQILSGVIAAYKADPAKLNADQLNVLVNPAVCDALEKSVLPTLSQTFHMKAAILADRNVKGGLKIGFAGANMYLDCTDSAIAELLSGYLSPKLAALVAETGKTE